MAGVTTSTGTLPALADRQAGCAYRIACWQLVVDVGCKLDLCRYLSASAAVQSPASAATCTGSMV